ncbi:MAG: hypothetical protein WCT42_03815 [Candidatus Paceibacterota bacterium]
MKDKKLVIGLLFLVIILLVGLAYSLGRSGYNREKNIDVSNINLPADYNANSDIKNQIIDGSWIVDSKIGLTYNSKWQVTPELYQTPAQKENGEPLSIVGYRFTLPSGNVINWGGHQEGCQRYEIKAPFSKFQYGVSTLACVKGMKANLGLNDVRLTLPKEDINSFGDFVLKNQDKIISQNEAENLVKKTWGDCLGEGCSNFRVTVIQNNLVAGIYPQLDDSVAFIKKESVAIYQNGTWTLGVPTITQACRLNRGHQDFSTVPCI